MCKESHCNKVGFMELLSKHYRDTRERTNNCLKDGVKSNGVFKEQVTFQQAPGAQGEELEAKFHGRASAEA